jgi:glutamine synthetase
MFCDVYKPDGRPAGSDTRVMLERAVARAESEGIGFKFGSKSEFYLFKLDDEGNRTEIPFDEAGYMDIAPVDKCENIRREICLTIEEMGLRPERSHHEEGPGQNKIDFRHADPLTAADDVMSYKTVVKTVAHSNGLYADFTPKPLKDKPGNAFHINISVGSDKHHTILPSVIAGIMKHIKDINLFLDPCDASYQRLGKFKAPKFISWSGENRSQLVRIPAAKGEYRRAELRSADPSANPYLAYTMLIYAGLDGMLNELPLSGSSINDMTLDGSEKFLSYEQLPGNFLEACETSASSDFIKEHIPSDIISIYCGE